jgi:hypothetical protein
MLYVCMFVCLYVCMQICKYVQKTLLEMGFIWVWVLDTYLLRPTADAQDVPVAEEHLHLLYLINRRR